MNMNGEADFHVIPLAEEITGMGPEEAKSVVGIRIKRGRKAAGLTAKELGEKLYLDSGTLTPVLKSLEQKGYVVRTRPAYDERTLLVTLTEAGQKLKDQAVSIPGKMVSSCVALSAEEAAQLYVILYKILGVDKSAR